MFASMFRVLACLLFAACSSTPAPDDLAVGSDAGLPLYAACDGGAQCMTGICFYYPARATSVCTKTCASANDCPAPSTGCNGMSVCKIP
jgi:hypothetical protein